MKKDGYELYRCVNCGLIFVYPQPDKKYLVEEVYSAKSGYQSYKTKNLLDIRLEKKTEKIFQYLEKNNIKGKLLDVGCSSGTFLYHAGKRGFNSYGIELNKHTADIAKNNGLNVFCGALEDSKFEDNFFNIIFLGDILEHVPKPRALLIECRRILRFGGYLIIATPNTDCFWSKATLKLNNIFGIPWSTATPPHHLYQFSFYNINLLLEELKLSPKEIAILS